MRNATQKEIDKFIEYRANHVALVQRIGKVVFDADLSEHDKDKIEANGEELNLFALRNSMLNGTYHPHKIDKSKLNKLTGKHVKSQKHHPEYWDDSITARNFDDENPPQVNAHKMPKKYLLEMCCDWSSCALYRNTPMFSWYNKTCTGEDARFLFTDNQKEYIIECISRIASKIKEENLHYPNVNYTAEADSPKIDFGKKLNESKEDVIYSKEFKEWFGDWENDTEHSSKVVDKDGKPLAVYHGSLSLFDSFDPNKGYNVPAIWHTDKLSISSHWSNTSDIHRNSKKVSEDFESLKILVKELESKNTSFEKVVKKISAFTEENFDIKIESRSIYTSLEDCKEYNLDPEEYEGISYGYDIIYNNGMEMSGNVKKDLHKCYKIILEYVEDMIKNATRDFIDYSHRGFLYKNYLNIRKPLIVDAKDEPYHNIRYKGKYYNTESLAMYAKERGYDGVIVRNVYETDYENKKGTDYIVFNPNQIKSATDNNGNFSKESDNMYEKILHKNNKWVVTDHTGKKNLGTYDTKEEAEKRLKQVEYFKHINESLIDSNNFKKWFGNSVVKDNEGNPLILYHGTPSTTPEITEFDSSKASNNYGEDTLIYATDSKEMAEFFSMDTTEGSLNFTKKLTGNKGKVYPLYMRLEHPMDFRNLTDRDIEALTQAYIEYKRDLGESKDNIEDIKNKYKEEIKKDFEFGVDFVKDRHLSYLVHPKYIHIFKEYGYDGIICPMREQEGIKDALEYAVISPNQIKSIDNQGTFSLQSNNIYEKVITSFGGKVPISNKDKDQILKFCKKAVEDGMEPTKYTEEEMVNSSNLSSGSIASNTPENNLKIINLGSEELIDLNEAYVVCNMDGSIVAGTYTTDLAKAKEMRKDLADKYRLFFQLKRVKDKEEKIEESTSKEKTCVFTFGRYQPPTKGHLKVWETLANTEADAHYIYTSHTKDKKKNPLDYNTKINLIEIALNENGINAEVVNSEAKTIIDVVSDIANKGFTDIIFVGGSDRLDDIVSLIRKYNDYPNKDGKAYHFNSISGISAGDRDPDSDSMEGISGTKIRQFALDGNYEAFKSNLAISDEGIAKELMKIINSNLK